MSDVRTVDGPGDGGGAGRDILIGDILISDILISDILFSWVYLFITWLYGTSGPERCSSIPVMITSSS